MIAKKPPKPKKAAAKDPRKTDTWLDTVDTDRMDTCVQHLLEAARGTSLILNSVCERQTIEEGNIIASGLAAALQLAADDVDANYFRSAGVIAHTIDHNLLTGLLKRELKKVAHLRRFKREMGRP